MGSSPRSWFGIVRKRFLLRSPSPQGSTIIVFHTNNTTTTTATTTSSTFTEEITSTPRERYANNITSIIEAAPTKSEFGKKKLQNYLSKEDIAVIKIQAFFRGHLARRAYLALKGLVKLQAVVRGVCMRRQSRITLHCMHALACLQITVRARHLLAG